MKDYLPIITHQALDLSMRPKDCAESAVVVFGSDRPVKLSFDKSLTSLIYCMNNVFYFKSVLLSSVLWVGVGCCLGPIIEPLCTGVWKCRCVPTFIVSRQAQVEKIKPGHQLYWSWIIRMIIIKESESHKWTIHACNFRQNWRRTFIVCCV